MLGLKSVSMSHRLGDFTTHTQEGVLARPELIDISQERSSVLHSTRIAFVIPFHTGPAARLLLRTSVPHCRNDELLTVGP